MKHEVTGIPAKAAYLKNLEDKMNDPEFLGDTTALLRPDETYDPNEGFDLVRKEIIERIPNNPIAQKTFYLTRQS